VYFAYPDGAAGRLFAGWLGRPMVLTLRGKEERQSRMSVAAPLKRAVLAVDQLVADSRALGDALSRSWDRQRMLEYVRANSWDRRIPALMDAFEKALVGTTARVAPSDVAVTGRGQVC
jgi:threonine synthase